MAGKIIVLEGTDGCGKSTQFACLKDLFDRQNIPFSYVAFPQYEKDSSFFVRKYLSGAFGEDPNAINPYAASTFFAMDRYLSYKSDWEARYQAGEWILMDRYVSSNAIYQAAKIRNDKERLAFLSWLWDYEYEKLALPKPEITLFLDMPPSFSMELMDRRNETKDIHEKDASYVQKSYEAACQVADLWGFTKIPCVRDSKIRSIEDISSEIAHLILSKLGVTTHPC